MKTIGCIGLSILFCLLAVSTVPTSVRADGVILPDDPTWGWLSIVYHHVDVQIRDGVVTTHVDQLFRNDSTVPIEGRYVFPLPPGAVVSAFSMWVDGEKREGEILPAAQARAIYEDYVRRTIDPALLEYIGRDTLAARIFPISPGRTRRIEITYSEIPQAEGELYRYRYPLDTERFSARPLSSVKIEVDLQTSAPTKAIYSPSHAVTVLRQNDRLADIHYEEKGVLPTTDFLLYYSVLPEETGMTLLTYRAPEEDGFFLLIVSPQVEAPSSAVIPKDLVLVLDRSGSMYGEKISQAKEALTFILKNLNPEDRFAVVAFSDIAQAQTDRLVPATPRAIDQAIGWVARVEADGGTNIDQALTTALSLFDQERRARFLVFLTDGEATVGETDTLTIIQNIGSANVAQTRLFAFGVGYDVNTLLLDRLAQENRGTSAYVEPGEDLEVKLTNFYRKIASPVLSSPRIEISSVEVYDLYPRVLPDLFRGSQLLLSGRYRGGGEATIDLFGHVKEQTVQFSYTRGFPAVSLADPFLPRLWAGRKIAHLLDQIRLYGESGELVEEVIRLSTRYGVITPYTSFLVEEEPLSAEEMQRAVTAAAGAPPMGKVAVQGSASLRALAEGEVAPQAQEAVRYVEDRAFFLKEGVWTQSTYSDEETIDIVSFSEAFFDLLDLLPSIAPYLSLGDLVILQVGEVYLRIGETGAEELTDEVLVQITG